MPESISSFLLRQVFADDDALTRSLQVDLSLALSVASRMAMPCAFMSSIILSIHVLVGLHLSLLSSTWLCSAIIGSLPFSFLVTCPNHVSLLFLILSTIVSFSSIFSRIISLRILSGLDFPSIPFSKLIPATRSFLSSSFFRHQHSEP